MAKLRHRKTNFKTLSEFSHYTPGFGGMLILLLLLLAGSLLGGLLISVLTPLMGAEAMASYGTLISYPVMFVPPVIWALHKSRRNVFFEKGYSLDSNHFGKCGGLLLALLAVIATEATSFMTDIVNSRMPAMPQWLEDALESLTHGDVWINALCVCVLAPVCEEWLCRGEVLRGLLNCRKAEGGKGIHPSVAIIVSALFFALIHANPWQAIPAFVLGCLFGYVYYRTGSLKLTMLMHCANNALALVCGQIDALADMDYWTDVLSPRMYGIIFAACALFVAMFVLTLSHIEVQGREGNCDEISE